MTHSEQTGGRPRVVVGVGESASGVRALRWAHEICRRRGWRLDVVTAWPDAGEPRIHEVPGHYCAPRGAALAALQAALSACGIDSGDPDVRVYVENADPVTALVEHSRGAELLVVGASGAGRSRRAGVPALGDLCQSRASCPVVVIDDPATAPRTA